MSVNECVSIQNHFALVLEGCILMICSLLFPFFMKKNWFTLIERERNKKQVEVSTAFSIVPVTCKVNQSENAYIQISRCNVPVMFWLNS